MYILTEAASKDIEKLLDRSVIHFGLDQTEVYFNSLKNCLMLLDENPAMGSAADDVKFGYRHFAHESHLIFYREHEQGILVVRLLHHAMDVKKQFSEQKENYLLIDE